MSAIERNDGERLKPENESKPYPYLYMYQRLDFLHFFSLLENNDDLHSAINPIEYLTSHSIKEMLARQINKYIYVCMSTSVWDKLIGRKRTKTAMINILLLSKYLKLFDAMGY